MGTSLLIACTAVADGSETGYRSTERPFCAGQARSVTGSSENLRRGEPRSPATWEPGRSPSFLISIEDDLDRVVVGFNIPQLQMMDDSVRDYLSIRTGDLDEAHSHSSWGRRSPCP